MHLTKHVQELKQHFNTQQNKATFNRDDDPVGLHWAKAWAASSLPKNEGDQYIEESHLAQALEGKLVSELEGHINC